MNNWKVYQHTSPSGHVYIGITSQDVSTRWKNGKGYHGCPKFRATIKKYGWNNIKHEILYENLSEHDAKQLEIKLISQYKDQGMSLNLTDGGDGARKPVSEEAKAKISESLRKYYTTHEGTMTGRHISEEAKARIRAKVTKYRHTEEAKAKISYHSRIQNAKRKGKPNDPKSVEKMRNSLIKYYSEHENATKNTIWIHKGGKRKRIHESMLNQFINQNWEKGYK